MRALIVKMSSMGDIIHTLPALTDAAKKFPEIQFDWVIEPSFAEIPLWHKAVNEVIPLPLRRWRKTPWQSFKEGEWWLFINKLRHKSYDFVLDPQGLVKSAIIAKIAKGKRYGFNRSSAKEGIVALTYHHCFNIEKSLHAVERVRQLFAKIFDYSLNTIPDYGIDKSRLATLSYGENCVLFLHGTTWPTKHWPEKYWQLLGTMVSQSGFKVLLPWGSEDEKFRAMRIQEFVNKQQVNLSAEVLPKLSLAQLTSLISSAKGIVAVDTGLGHVAAAMGVPTVSLYGPTNPGLTGAYGPNQYHLQVDFACSPCLGRECKRGTHFETMPPCFESLPPKKVWEKLMQAMAGVCHE